MKLLNTLVFSSVLTLATVSFAKDSTSIKDLETRISSLEAQINSMQPQKHSRFKDDIFGWRNFDHMLKRHNMMMSKMMDDMPSSSFSTERTKDKIIVKAKLDNMTKDDIDVSVEDNIMTIKANKKSSKKIDDEDKKAYSEESQSFMQQVSLPKNANIDKIDTEYQDGELTIEIPLNKRMKKQIKID